MQIEFRSARFVKSCPNLKEKPEKNLPEVIFIGKSNVGKSSLINALCGNKSLAFTSSKPGHTRLLNYYEIKDLMYLVDAPGYGYSAAGKQHTLLFGDFMEEYFNHNPNLKLVVYLLDSRRIPNDDDIDFYNFVNENNLPYVITMTKCDKLNQSEKSKIMKNITSAFNEVNKEQILLTSANDQNSLLNLKKVIASKI